MNNNNHRCPKTGRFLKGFVPENKGKKQEEYMSAEAIEKSKATRFQKGNVPHNHKPVGYERITVDGYIEIKMAEPNVFKLKHRVVWEQNFGKIPKGHNIQFRDGNRQNLDISNLYMISRADQLKNENSIYNYPEDIRRTIHAVGVLSRTINKHNKSNKN